MYLRRVLGVGFALKAAGASAHSMAADEFNPWLPDPLALFLLLLVASLYWRGSRTMPRQASRKRQEKHALFWGGLAALAIALASPLDAFGEVLFSVHMLQHELMMLIAAPLLVASQPSAVLLRGMPRLAARSVGAMLRSSGASSWMAWLTYPAVAWFVHAAGLWGWHLPVLFSAGLRSDFVHSLQHLSFLLIALVFWFAVLKPRQSAPAANVLYLFTTAIHASLLGALLTFSPRVWYTPYLTTAPEWGLHALEDQQLGGLIMWMPAGIVFLLAALFSLAGAMQRSGKRRHSGL